MSALRCSTRGAGLLCFMRASHLVATVLFLCATCGAGRVVKDSESLAVALADASTVQIHIRGACWCLEVAVLLP